MFESLRPKIKYFFSSQLFYPLLLLTIISAAYYKFVLFGKIPFPGDLLIGSYYPWLDYYKMPVQNPLISDVFSQFFLWKYLAADQLKNFQWPLWNPYSFTGNPLLATYHSAALYPLNILLFLPKPFGWGLFIFSQTIIAAFSMYLLLSVWLKSRLARLTGSIIFAFSGLMTTWAELGTAVHAIAWLPASLFCIEKYISEQKTRYLIFLVFLLSLIIYAGNVQITTYSFVIITTYTLIRSWNKNFSLFFGKIIPIFIATIFACLLSAPQLLPSFELLQKSIRLNDSYIQQDNYGLLKMGDIFRFFVADFFGNPVKRNYWGFLNYSETSNFVGTLTLPLIIFTFLFLKKNRLSFYFILLFLFSLILSFDNTISRTIYSSKIPFLTSSYASRMLFVSTFSISIMSAFSINQIFQQPNQKNNLLKCLIWSQAALIGVIGGILAIKQIIKMIVDSAPSDTIKNFYLSQSDYSLVNFQITLRNILLPAMIMTIVLVSSLLYIKFNKIISSRFPNKIFPKDLTFIIFILSLFIIIDLSLYFIKYNPFVPANLVFPTTPALEYLQKQPQLFRVGREHAEVLPPNTWTAYNLQSFEGYDPLYLNQYGKFMHFLNGGDLRTGNTGRYAELSKNFSSPFLDAANVKYFIGILRDQNGNIPGGLMNFQFEEAEYKIVFRDKTSIIVENPNALDRVYFASAVSFIPERVIENTIMDDKTFDPRKKVLLADDLEINLVTGQGIARITSYTPNEVKITTDTKQEEVLVLADQFDENWKASIDGKDTKVSQANFIFRAIKIPAGKHDVTFFYNPTMFKWGLKINALSFILIAGFFLLQYKIRKTNL